MRTRLGMVTVVAASIALGGVAVAGGPALDGGWAKTSITVTPAEGLGPTATVLVSGSGYPPGLGIQIRECSALPWTAQGADSDTKAPVCGPGPVRTVTDADGNYGPVEFEVASSFYGESRHGPQFHSCLPQNDCQLAAFTQTGPNVVAWHHLTFAP